MFLGIKARLFWLLDKLNWFGRIVAMAAYKFYWDDCFSRASSLAYTTLFALVPITALTFAIFGASGLNLGEADLRLMLHQLLPPTENKLLEDLQQEVFSKLAIFGESVRALGNISLAVLIFTGIALLNTIESALNTVWRVTSNLSILSKIITFWAVITLGPLLVAVSFYWYTRVSLNAHPQTFIGPGWVGFLDVAIPISLIWAALTLLYYRLPAAKVAASDAALGGLFAAILFELMKRGFAYYVSLSSSWNTFYGALVSIPLFLFWLYLIWVAILFGAEISYQAGSIKILHGLRKYASELGEIGALLGLRILFFIGQRFSAGLPPPTEGEIALETGSDPVLVRTCLGILSEAGMITVVDPENHTRSLALTPERISVGDVMQAFRAKRYRTTKDEQKKNGELNVFLENLRSVWLQTAGESPVYQWTLAQLLLARSGDVAAMVHRTRTSAPAGQADTEDIH